MPDLAPLMPLSQQLFREVAFLAQTLFRATLKVQSGQLVIIGGGTFPASIQPGHVAMLGERPLEIVSITSSTSLTVSLTRAHAAGQVLVPADTADLPGSIATFDPQIGIIHQQILRMLGLEAARQTLDADGPGESAVLNPADLSLVETLGSLHLIYSAAAAALTVDSPLATRAAHFRERFAQERWRARAIIDLDADGRADTVRTLNVIRLTR